MSLVIVHDVIWRGFINNWLNIFEKIGYCFTGNTSPFYADVLAYSWQDDFLLALEEASQPIISWHIVFKLRNYAAICLQVIFDEGAQGLLGEGQAVFPQKGDAPGELSLFCRRQAGGSPRRRRLLIAVIAAVQHGGGHTMPLRRLPVRGTAADIQQGTDYILLRVGGWRPLPDVGHPGMIEMI